MKTRRRRNGRRCAAAALAGMLAIPGALSGASLAQGEETGLEQSPFLMTGETGEEDAVSGVAGSSVTGGLLSGTTTMSAIAQFFALTADYVELPVETVYAEEGDAVKEGDPLYRISPDAMEELGRFLESEMQSAQEAVWQAEMDYQKGVKEAEYERERAIADGEAAESERKLIEEKLQKTVDDNYKNMEEAQENLARLEEKLAKGVTTTTEQIRIPAVVYSFAQKVISGNGEGTEGGNETEEKSGGENMQSENVGTKETGLPGAGLSGNGAGGGLLSGGITAGNTGDGTELGRQTEGESGTEGAEEESSSTEEESSSTEEESSGTEEDSSSSEAVLAQITAFEDEWEMKIREKEEEISDMRLQIDEMETSQLRLISEMAEQIDHLIQNPSYRESTETVFEESEQLRVLNAMKQVMKQTISMQNESAAVQSDNLINRIEKELEERMEETTASPDSESGPELISTEAEAFNQEANQEGGMETEAVKEEEETESESSLQTEGPGGEETEFESSLQSESPEGKETEPESSLQNSETMEEEPENTEAENTEAESTEAESTEAENTEAESTEAENTEAENTEAESTEPVTDEPQELLRYKVTLHTQQLDFTKLVSVLNQYMELYEQKTGLLSELQTAEKEWQELNAQKKTELLELASRIDQQLADNPPQETEPTKPAADPADGFIGGTDMDASNSQYAGSVGGLEQSVGSGSSQAGYGAKHFDIREIVKDLKLCIPGLQVMITESEVTQKLEKIAAERDYELAAAKAENAEEAYEVSIASLKNAADEAKEKLSKLQKEQELYESMSDGVIYAERSGTVGSIAYKTGELLVPGSELITYLDSSSVEILIEVGQEDIADFAVGNTVEVIIDGKNTAKGTICRAATEATAGRSASKVTYTVTVTVDNSGGEYKAGSPAMIFQTNESEKDRTE